LLRGRENNGCYVPSKRGAISLQGQKEIMDEGDAGGAPTSPSKVLRKAKSHGSVYDVDEVPQGDK
jgi:hypothetical protein